MREIFPSSPFSIGVVYDLHGQRGSQDLRWFYSSFLHYNPRTTNRTRKILDLQRFYFSFAFRGLVDPVIHGRIHVTAVDQPVSPY